MNQLSHRRSDDRAWLNIADFRLQIVETRLLVYGATNLLQYCSFCRIADDTVFLLLESVRISILKCFYPTPPPNNPLDVRAKQRLCYHVVFLTRSCVDSVSPHVRYCVESQTVFAQFGSNGLPVFKTP